MRVSVKRSVVRSVSVNVTRSPIPKNILLPVAQSLNLDRKENWFQKSEFYFDVDTGKFTADVYVAHREPMKRFAADSVLKVLTEVWYYRNRRLIPKEIRV